MTTGPHISLSAETLFTVGGFAITNSMFTSVILSTLLILFGVAVNRTLKATNKPSGLQNFAEAVIEALYNLMYTVTQSHSKTTFFFPFIASFFLFILVNNWAGLLPGVGTVGITREESTEHAELLQAIPAIKVSAATPAADSHAAAPEAAVLVHEDEVAVDGQVEAAEESHEAEEAEHAGPVFVPLIRPGTADLNTTLALGIISVAVTQFIGVRYLKLGYFKKFINFSSPIMFVVGILELISEFAKIVSFAFRLFGNIFAGEVLLTVIAFIGGTFLFFAPLPFYGLEVFVGFIQALVFSMLSLVFFNMATISHDEH
jgi:F-type H+-transporting ATPase subunit a